MSVNTIYLVIKMSTYSTVDTILTPSLIDISPIVDPGINQGVLQSMGSESQLNISPIPWNFPLAATGQGVPVITIITESNQPTGAELSDNIISNPIQSPSAALSLADQNNIITYRPSIGVGLQDEMEDTSDDVLLHSSPIDTIASARKVCSAITTEEVMECLRKTRVNKTGTSQEEFPTKDLPSVPAFAPPKNISVDGATNSTLKQQLNNQNKLVRQTALTLLEKRIITMQGKCPDSIVENLRIRLFQLDPSTISDYLNSYGKFDHDYQDGMGCLIDALISDEDIIPDIRLRRWITDINRIGGQSAEGMTFKLSSDAAKLDESNGQPLNSSHWDNVPSKGYPLYVIKVAADPNEDTLPHEALVGMGAVNKVRDRVPNFMHTYGAFMCAPPILDSDGKVVSWCPSKTNGITYLVLENIEDAVSLKSIAWDLTDSEFLQIYLQVLNALNVAYKEFDFTHYDLHDGNVLIQILPYYVSVPLYTQEGLQLKGAEAPSSHFIWPGPSQRDIGGVHYIRTRHLARIIDYGMSHIYLQGQHFGKYDVEFAGVDAESSFPMHDAYKILLFTYASSLQRKKDNKYEVRISSGFSNVASNIYQFFNEGKTIETRLKERNFDPWGDYYQPSDSYKNITFDDLISFILSKYNMDFITLQQPADAIATVCQDVCVGWNEFTQHIFSQSKLPATLEDYCQAELAIDNLSNNQTKLSLQRWLRQFNVESTYERERSSIVDKLNKSIQDLNGIMLLPIYDPLFNYVIYEKHLQTLIAIQYQLLNVQLWLEAVYCAFNLNSNISYVSDDLVQFTKGWNNARQRLNDYLMIVQFNITNDVNDEFTGQTRILHNVLMTPIN